MVSFDFILKRLQSFQTKNMKLESKEVSKISDLPLMKIDLELIKNIYSILSLIFILTTNKLLNFLKNKSFFEKNLHLIFK